MGRIRKGRAVTRKILMLTGLAGLGMAGCVGPMGSPGVTRLMEPEAQVFRATEGGPPGAAANTCWGRDVTPAAYETVTEQIMIQPAQITASGQVTSPAVFKTETNQRVTRERREIWFETPCPEDMTPDFIASVQRALQARGLYAGPIHGEADRNTRRAVRRYQAQEGLNSAVLSMAAARKLGLVAVDRASLEAEG